ncbi:hypothetical protein RUND412_006488 [Rhizina undulata]
MSNVRYPPQRGSSTPVPGLARELVAVVVTGAVSLSVTDTWLSSGPLRWSQKIPRLGIFGTNPRPRPSALASLPINGPITERWILNSYVSLHYPFNTVLEVHRGSPHHARPLRGNFIFTYPSIIETQPVPAADHYIESHFLWKIPLALDGQAFMSELMVELWFIRSSRLG